MMLWLRRRWAPILLAATVCYLLLALLLPLPIAGVWAGTIVLAALFMAVLADHPS